MPTQERLKEARNKLLSISEVAEELGISRWSVYRLIKTEDLIVTVWGVSARKLKYVRRVDLDRYINSLTKRRRSKPVVADDDEEEETA